MSVEAHSLRDFSAAVAEAAGQGVSGTAALSGVSTFATPLPPAARAWAAASRSLDPSIGIVVCIPCFRRPQHLRLTLESLADQRTDRRFAVVIVENDASACGSVPVAAEFLGSGKFPGLCVVEPRQGNCHAINAAFETALATFPARQPFPDDRRRRDCLAGLAGADGARRRGHRRRCGRRPGASEFRRRHASAGCVAIRRFCPAYDNSGPVPVIYGCGNCLITAIGVCEARRVPPSTCASIFSAAATSISSPAAGGPE